jgi:hypothetical protein
VEASYCQCRRERLKNTVTSSNPSFLIALAGVLLLAFLPIRVQAAKTADAKCEAVINLENAWKLRRRAP